MNIHLIKSLLSVKRNCLNFFDDFPKAWDSK